MRRIADPIERFWSRVDTTAGVFGCWPWTGGKTAGGYGELRTEDGTAYAHRVSVQLSGREIPAGMEPDHLCRNRACVNPAHLEVVTHRANTLRGVSPAAINATKTHCLRGHLFDEANTYRDRDGHRGCRRCHSIQENTRYHRFAGPPLTPEQRSARSRRAARARWDRAAAAA